MDPKESTKKYMITTAPFMWILTVVYDRIFEIWPSAELLKAALEDYTIERNGKPYEPILLLRYEHFPLNLTRYHIMNFLRGLIYLNIAEIDYKGSKGKLTARIKVREFINTFAQHIPEIRKRLESGDAE